MRSPRNYLIGVGSRDQRFCLTRSGELLAIGDLSAAVLGDGNGRFPPQDPLSPARHYFQKRYSMMAHMQQTEGTTLAMLDSAAEQEKVACFEALGIERRLLPSRVYRGAVGRQRRYFALKLPIAVDSRAVTFVYADPGHDTDSELRSWGWGAARALVRFDASRTCRPRPGAHSSILPLPAISRLS